MSETPPSRQSGRGRQQEKSWQTFVLAGSLCCLSPSSPSLSPSLLLHRLHNYAKICCATQYFFCFPPSLLAFWTGTATGIFLLHRPPPSPLSHCPSSPTACLSFACFPLAPVELAASQLRQLGAHLFFRIIFSALLHFSGPGAGRGAGAGRDSLPSSSSSASFWLFYA